MIFVLFKDSADSEALRETSIFMLHRFLMFGKTIHAKTKTVISHGVTGRAEKGLDRI
jgi:hypothetical protein